MCIAGGGSGGGMTAAPGTMPGTQLYPGFGSTDSTGVVWTPANSAGGQPVPVLAGPATSGDFRSPYPAAVKAPEKPKPTAPKVEPPKSKPLPPPLVPRAPVVDKPQDPVARWGERYYRSRVARGEGSVARFGFAGGNYRSKLGSAAA